MRLRVRAERGVARSVPSSQRMRVYAGRVDLVIADGGSTDGALAAEFLASCGVRALFDQARPRPAQRPDAHGPGVRAFPQLRGGRRHGRQQQGRSPALPHFVGLLEAGFDHVQGSRYLLGGKAINTPLSRHLAVRWIHAPLIRLASGFRYTDTTNGFRAYSRRLLLDPRVAPFREVFSAYELHYYLAIRAARLGFRVCETPVTRAYPAKGKTPTKIRGLRGNLRILRTLWKACRHRYDPPAA